MRWARDDEEDDEGEDVDIVDWEEARANVPHHRQISKHFIVNEASLKNVVRSG
jgi:hypothetical protein